MALDDLTPREVVALVYLFQAMPDNAMVPNENNELTMLDNLPGVQSLAKKLNEAGKRDDVKDYINQIKGSG